MVKLHDFLVEHAKFPFPVPDELRSVSTTDISEVEVGFLAREWKATCAVRDDNLLQKLCSALKNILGDTPLVAGSENYLIASFSPLLEVDEAGVTNSRWLRNRDEIKSCSLLDLGIHEAARRCLSNYGRYDVDEESTAERGSSRVDYVVLMNDESMVLMEAKSPSVMKEVGQLLPPRGINFTWLRNQPLVPKVLSKVALYLGLRQMKWLFLTCHNYWIVCRLVRDDENPFLAYSPMISIQDSSLPFRAFLGALLSVVMDFPVEPSVFNPDIQFDVIEEKDEGPLSEDDVNDGSGPYRGTSSKGLSVSLPMTRSRAGGGNENAESGLMVTSSSPNSAESFQVWIHLHPFSNNVLTLPQSAKKGKQHVWLTRFIGFGSTGNVWQCRFDSSSESFVAKVVEVQRRADIDSRRRLRNEFNVYLALEKAYQSGQLCEHIAPHCYGAFEGDGIDIIILDLCDSALSSWAELTSSERDQIFMLVQDLHHVGIMHGDLEPRNIMRTREGRLRLIDFTESRKHVCNKSPIQCADQLDSVPAPSPMCRELRTLRNLLWKRQPFQAHREIQVVS